MPDIRRPMASIKCAFMVNGEPGARFCDQILISQPAVRPKGGGESRTSMGGQQVRSSDQSPQPEPMPASGNNNDRRMGKAGVDGKEASQKQSGLDPDTEAAVGQRQTESLSGNSADVGHQEGP